MEKNQIIPEKITKPIQLLGAWLVGLLAIDASFLFAATNMGTTSWQSSALTVAAIVNVPIFIVALFLLQTKFRPELQEDSFYSTYLNSKTNQLIKISKKEVQFEEIERRIEALEKRQKVIAGNGNRSSLSKLSYALNCHLLNQKEIEAKLSEIGVEIIREFGETSSAPDGMKVAIADRVPDEVRNEILALASQLGFEHYSTIHPWEDIDEDVLFGAYGDADGRILRKVA
jgi:hypothetical protein